MDRMTLDDAPATTADTDVFVTRDNLLVKMLEAPAKTKSGFHIPETVRERPRQGIVLAVGPGSLTESGAIVPLPLSVGDLVYFNKHAGVEFTPEDPTLLLIGYNEVPGGKRLGSFTVVPHVVKGTAHLLGDACDICNPQEATPEPEAPPLAPVEDLEERRRRMELLRQEVNLVAERVADEAPLDKPRPDDEC